MRLDKHLLALDLSSHYAKKILFTYLNGHTPFPSLSKVVIAFYIFTFFLLLLLEKLNLQYTHIMYSNNIFIRVVIIASWKLISN